jgi:hypothetical protein
MLPVQELTTNLNLTKRELWIPLDAQKYFYVDAENTKVFIDQVLELEESEMKFFSVKQSQPYSNSLDKATIVNNSNATVTQQETFTKTTTGTQFNNEITNHFCPAQHSCTLLFIFKPSLHYNLYFVDSYTFTNTKGFSKGAAVNATIGTPFAGGVGKI